MITNTGKILIGGCMSQTVRSNHFAQPPVDVNGTEHSTTFPSAFVGDTGGGRFATPIATNDFSTQGIFIRLGVGDTEMQKTDYNLNNVFINGVDVNTIVKCLSLTTVMSPNSEACLVGVFTNTGNVDIDIKEVGVFVTVVSTAPDRAGSYMIARNTVPGGKLTLKAGETNTLTAQINFNSAI